MTGRLASLAALMISLLAASGSAQSATLDLKRVMLSSGGVGYFEYEATVSGDDTLTLEIRLDQVDDVLKSLVVYDAKGSVVSVSLPSREPLAQSLRDLPFDAHALDTPKALLNALQGAELKVGNPKPMAGRILKAEDETSTIRDGQTITRTRVSLMTTAGLQQFVLEDADAVGFVDPTLQAKLADALATIARHRDSGRRTLTLQTHAGENRGENRTVRVGYVVGAPLWKASYRLTFDADPVADKARLQGWAVLENTTAQDWHNVELTLLSGNPVTFRQALYESYYVTRPEVPVEVVGRVLPKLDEGAVAAAQTAERQRADAAPLRSAMASAPAPRPMPPMPAQAFEQPAMAPVASADTTEGGTQVAFKLAEPVSLEAGRSAVVPLLDRALPAARLSVLQANAKDPFASFQLTNDSQSGLPPGVLTLYERAPADGATAYVGDARLATFPIGEQRLLSYAVDSKLRIDRATATISPVTAAAISNGVLRLTRTMRQTTTYRLSAPAQDARQVILEQPRLGGWNLVEPDPGAIPMTPGAYRIPVALQPGEQKTVAVVLALPRQEEIRILTADDAQLGTLVSAQELAPKLREALAEVAHRRQDLAERRNALQHLQAERDELAKDQSRVRDNLNAVPKGTPLYNRLIDTLAAEETRLDALAQSNSAANAEIDKATAALTDYVNKLTL